MNILKVFSSNVRKYRKIKGFSQEELAFISGLHRTYISAVEREKRNISLVNINKLAEALEIKPYLLLLEETEHENE